MAECGGGGGNDGAEGPLLVFLLAFLLCCPVFACLAQNMQMHPGHIICQLTCFQLRGEAHVGYSLPFSLAHLSQQARPAVARRSRWPASFSTAEQRRQQQQAAAWLCKQDGTFSGWVGRVGVWVCDLDIRGVGCLGASGQLFGVCWGASAGGKRGAGPSVPRLFVGFCSFPHARHQGWVRITDDRCTTGKLDY